MQYSLVLAAFLGTISQEQLVQAISLQRHHHHHHHDTDFLEYDYVHHHPKGVTLLSDVEEDAGFITGTPAPGAPVPIVESPVPSKVETEMKAKEGAPVKVATKKPTTVQQDQYAEQEAEFKVEQTKKIEKQAKETASNEADKQEASIEALGAKKSELKLIVDAVNETEVKEKVKEAIAAKEAPPAEKDFGKEVIALVKTAEIKEHKDSVKSLTKAVQNDPEDDYHTKEKLALALKKVAKDEEYEAEVDAEEKFEAQVEAKATNEVALVKAVAAKKEAEIAAIV